jgi:hypothetical protein
MLNVREALAIFLNLLKSGMKGPMTHSWSPVMIATDRFLINACSEAEVAAKMAHKKIDTLAFVRWQHDTLTQKGPPTKYGLYASAYAYVGDSKDISTWFLQSDTKDEVKKSLRLVMQCEGVPDRKKEAIKLKLQAIKKKLSAN